MASHLRNPIAPLYLVFSLSGAAALVFEVLLFRRAGLAFGNSIWAVSLVLCSFMGGLAIGNGLMAARGHLIRRPILTYVVLEAWIGVLGLLLVWSLPSLTTVLTPLFRLVVDTPWLLNPIRLGIGLLVMLLPAVAMGMTLPILVSALCARDRNFGSVLGRLYGWNTLGAVVGVLIAERVLVDAFGVIGAAAVAAGMNALAAAGALLVHRNLGPVGGPPPDGALPAAPAAPIRADSRRSVRLRIMAAAFVCGATLLALEVLWFRFFHLFSMPLGWNLAVMLAVVLTGIGLGGVAASLWFRWNPEAHAFVGPVALGTGALVGFLYLALPGWMERGLDEPLEPVYVLLMLPVCVGSGLLFTLLGRALHAQGVPEIRAAGQITLANTIGSALGPLVAAFFCLPWLGLDRSFFLMSLAYGGVALLMTGLHARHRAARLSWGRLAAVLVFLAAVALFPTDAMNRSLLRSGRSMFAALHPIGLELVEVREGPIETIQLYRKDLAGEPYVYLLATNGFSMSGTMLRARRYMKLYAYWPAAVHGNLQDALLISYGVGSTAKALADIPTLRTIDVVDISKDILEVSHVIEPDAQQHPLNDPRVKVHVEDGRFFLAVTDRQYDLITAEPPPPRHAGIVNLYSLEYFRLIRDRLRNGGIVTYWLPVRQLRDAEAKSIVKAFRTVFPESSLWTGAGLEWMMVGVKSPCGPVSAEEFSRQWQDPQRAPTLRRLGFLGPDQLGALFIADGPRLDAWLGDALPLDDDNPLRIAAHEVEIPSSDLAGYAQLMHSPEAEENFRTSSHIGILWPPEIRERTLRWFAPQRTVNTILLYRELCYRELHAALETRPLRDLVLWVLDSDEKAQELLRRIPAEEISTNAGDADLYRHLAAGAVRDGRLLEAVELLDRAELRYRQAGRRAPRRDYHTRIYLLLRAGQPERATELLVRLTRKVQHVPAQLDRVREFWSWVCGVFGVSYDWDSVLAKAGAPAGTLRTAQMPTFGSLGPVPAEPQ